MAMYACARAVCGGQGARAARRDATPAAPDLDHRFRRRQRGASPGGLSRRRRRRRTPARPPDAARSCPAIQLQRRNLSVRDGGRARYGDGTARRPRCACASSRRSRSRRRACSTCMNTTEPGAGRARRRRRDARRLPGGTARCPWAAPCSSSPAKDGAARSCLRRAKPAIVEMLGTNPRLGVRCPPTRAASASRPPRYASGRQARCRRTRRRRPRRRSLFVNRAGEVTASLLALSASIGGHRRGSTRRRAPSSRAVARIDRDK